jgi:hypothetical protein
LKIHPKQGQKNGKKTENCARKLVCHFTKKRLMRLFFGIEYRTEKNILILAKSKFCHLLDTGTPP